MKSVQKEPTVKRCLLILDIEPFHRNIYKNTRNNYSNIFIVLGALKSLLCFPLDIDTSDIFTCHTNYLLGKCLKNSMANK